jgi:D-threo-aldose 1-dehydrogenase
MAIPKIDRTFGMGVSPFGNLFQRTTDEASIAAVDAAWDAGIRYFDTAPHYGLGLAERRLGRGLAGRPREEFLVSTKVGRLLVPSPETADQPDGDLFLVPAESQRVWDFSRDGILRSIEGSLERLGLDRVDIVYLHDPDDHWEAASTTGVDTLVELREQGVIRAFGAGMNQTEMLTEFVRRCDVDLVVLASRYTLLEQGGLDDLFPIAEERGVEVVAAAVFNSGLLSQARVPDDATYAYRQAAPELLARARAIAAVCERHGVELPAAALQFPLRQRAIRTVLIGMGFAEHVTANVERARAPIPERLWTDLVREGYLPERAAFPV